MKESNPTPVASRPVLPPPVHPVSELRRDLEPVWEQLDALGEKPLSLEELQREALEEAE
jgi:hypothetical protein